MLSASLLSLFPLRKRGSVGGAGLCWAVCLGVVTHGVYPEHCAGVPSSETISEFPRELFRKDHALTALPAPLGCPQSLHQHLWPRAAPCGLTLSKGSPGGALRSQDTKSNSHLFCQLDKGLRLPAFQHAIYLLVFLPRS